MTATPSDTPAPTPSGNVTSPSTVPTTDAGTTWWPWLVLLLIAVAAIAWFVRARRSRKQVVDDWDARLDRVRADAAWVEGSLVEQVLSRPTTREAQAVWSAAGARLLEIDELFHALTLQPPDEQRGAAAAGLRDRFGDLVEVVGADVSADSGRQGSTPDDFRAGRAAIDVAREGLRAALESDVTDAHR